MTIFCTEEHDPRCSARSTEPVHDVGMTPGLQRLMTVAAKFLHQAYGAEKRSRTTEPTVQNIRADLEVCIVWWPRGPSMLVHCLQGTAWITMAGDRRDHVLRPGDRVVLHGRGLAALHAIGNASVHCSVTHIDSTTDWQACARPTKIET